MAGDIGDGIDIFANAKGNVFFNVNMVRFGFGWFSGVDGMGQFEIPQSLIKLLTQGNSEDHYSGSFGMGAAVFAETGVWVSAKIIKEIKITVRPSYFLPIFYMTKPEAYYDLETNSEEGTIDAFGMANASLYTPYPTETGSSIDIGNMLGKGGGDLTLGVEYPLFSNLILGASFTHIPLFPARLSDGYKLITNFSYNEDDGFESREPSFDPFSGAAEQKVFRPFKMGFDVLYRPFKVDIFSLRPRAALVFNGIYDTPG
jgi:hypothetical protein